MELKPCKCRHGIGTHLNEIGEEEVFCDLTARWMNVSLGDCLGNCESEESNCRVGEGEKNGNQENL